MSPTADFALSYPEFCELLGLVAHTAVGATHASAVLGTSNPSMLNRLQLLFVDMAHRGAVWPVHIAAAMNGIVRAVEGALKGASSAGGGGGVGREEAARAATRLAMTRLQ